MDTPLISVIIPIYNVEIYIDQCINSVISQSYKNLEIILVNDGSPDKCNIICEKYKKIDSRIILIKKNNGGLSSARNAGIEIAKGEFIFFLDGDDFIDQKTIEILYSNIKKLDNIGIVGSPCFYSYYNGTKTKYRKDWDIIEERIIHYNDFCTKTLEQKCSHSACCKLYKKELLKNIRFREGRNNEDTLFMFDLSAILVKNKLNMLEIPYYLYYYRINSESISRNDIIAFHINIIDNINFMMKETSDIKIYNVLQSRYYIQLICFNSDLLTLRLNKKDSRTIKYNRLFKEIKTINLLNKIPAKQFIKYILLKYIPSIYTIIYNKFHTRIIK